MAHPRWPGFDTKTGNPIFDNQSLRLNRKIWKGSQQSVRFKSSKGRIPRKRLKQMKRYEGAKYITVLVQAMNSIAKSKNGKI